MTVNAKIVQLNKVLALLNEADCLLQGVLGPSDECYEMHNAIENVSDDVCDVIRTLDEDKDYLDSDAHLEQVK